MAGDTSGVLQLATNGSTTAVTVNASQNVGIGTASPQTKFQVTKTGSEGTNLPTWFQYSTASAVFSTGDGGSADGYVKSQTGIYNSASTNNLDLITQNKDNTYDAGFRITAGSGSGATTNNGYLAFSRIATTGSAITATERMRIDSSGNVGIGVNSPSNPLDVSGSIRVQDNSHPFILLEDIGNSTSKIGVSGSGAGLDNMYFAGYSSAGSSTYDLRIAGTNGYVNTRTNLSVGGALSKASGSFKIKHPLPEKEETHHLVHSFVEAPQADLIYRGKVQLENGVATVNIDATSGMTEGTFVALNRAVQCFTSNETDWDSVRGSVNGNILTIECQNQSSIATISWLVIGERQDKHMYETDWTDEIGKVIVEPLKASIETLENA
jgi:hypothetical protein